MRFTLPVLALAAMAVAMATPAENSKQVANTKQIENGELRNCVYGYRYCGITLLSTGETSLTSPPYMVLPNSEKTDLSLGDYQGEIIDALRLANQPTEQENSVGRSSYSSGMQKVWVSSLYRGLLSIGLPAQLPSPVLHTKEFQGSHYKARQDPKLEQEIAALEASKLQQLRVLEKVNRESKETAGSFRDTVVELESELETLKARITQLSEDLKTVRADATEVLEHLPGDVAKIEKELEFLETTTNKEQGELRRPTKIWQQCLRNGLLLPWTLLARRSWMIELSTETGFLQLQTASGTDVQNEPVAGAVATCFNNAHGH
ncbi:hypothetical protein T440DRAFT_510211 [Plenodomus tracheiphilus IPT5]|uniref:Uncharacterized protein n=1 Tax=Plenodomus tracheiphilus IPT5 TaxID=1408161 RepID=A0A6A7AVM8_9PLEO|nr:hypothetical protein T440DRAFT_510211 [Plenodomus tracheiphilus IPT5]